MMLPSFAAAAVLDPYDLAPSISVDGDADRLYIDLSGFEAYWHIHNESTSYDKEVYGNGIAFGTPMRFFDNLEAECYPTAFDTISIDGVTTDSTFNFNYEVIVGSADTTQSFAAKVTLVSLLYDSSGVNVSSIKLAETSALSVAASSFRTFTLSSSVQYADFVVDPSAVSFELYLFITFSDVEDETDDVSCTLELSGSTNISMSISSLYHQVQETGKGNEIMESVEQQLQENGQKLDDLITGGDAGDDLIAGGDKLEDVGEGLGDDIGQIGDFEDQYFGQLEDNLDEVIAGADLSLLVSPLLFIQVYLNKIVAGTPSKYLVVFTLPVLFGIFMYIVGHPIRAPRPDTSGDVVTRETFTTTTVLDGPRAGSTTSSRTVTTSQEIGRIHSG